MAARAATRAALAATRPRSILLTCGARPAAAAAVVVSAPRSRLPLLHPRSLATRAAAAAVAPTTTKPSKPLQIPTSPNNWQVRMLYDGECALCMKEVNMLQKRDAGAGKIDFVDIASEAYSADLNCGISYETAMAKIHAIRPDGQVLTGIAVFRALYEAVGLGWVYAVTGTPAIENAANRVYDFWAKYRTQVTGREDMASIFEARRRRLAAVAASGEDELDGSECRIDGSGCGSSSSMSEEGGGADGGGAGAAGAK